jgi:hypothetical protein
MPSQRCVVQGCSNTSNLQQGISIHKSPKDKRTLSKWCKFVKTHRLNFDPCGRFVICSEHFENSCFRRKFHVEGSPRILSPGSVPTIWKSPANEAGNEVQVSARGHRQVRSIFIRGIPIGLF